MAKPLYKTQITIWSEYPTYEVEIRDLAGQATNGDAYCSRETCELISDPAGDPDWDGTEFFTSDPEEDEPETAFGEGFGGQDITYER